MWKRVREYFGITEINNIDDELYDLRKVEGLVINNRK